jgi:arginase family enzyme
MDELRQRLERILRPACGGIYTVSTGTHEQRRLQQRIYGADSDDQVIDRWRAALDRLPGAKVAILGIPSDVGAGFLRGANMGPQAIRRELLASASFLYADPAVVDIGDVLVVPQLLHDEMLAPDQLARTREAVYGADAPPLPVSPLSVAEEVLRLVRALAPNAAPLVLGGDHSVGWPSLAAVAAGREQEVGILHFDAHTDLMQHRLGVKYCFATWAYHANELIGRGGRLAQVGLRVSRKSRADWERELGVRQYWMAEMRERPAADVAAEIIASWQAAGVKGVYISNDIDGTDPLFGLATGTPEPGGLYPETVLKLINTVGAAFPVWGSDLVEVAPPLAGHSPREPAVTLRTAANYVEAQARLSLSANEGP